MSAPTRREPEVNKLFRIAAKNGASALHLHVGLAPVLTVGGRSREIEMRALTPQDLEHLVSPILGSDEKLRLDCGEPVTFTHAVETHLVFRLTISRSSGRLKLSAHPLPAGN